jgi:hypothetical protein
MMSNDMYNTMTEIESPRIYRFGYVFKKNKKKQNKLWVAVNLSRAPLNDRQFTHLWLTSLLASYGSQSDLTKRRKKITFRSPGVLRGLSKPIISPWSCESWLKWILIKGQQTLSHKVIYSITTRFKDNQLLWKYLANEYRKVW